MNLWVNNTEGMFFWHSEHITFPGRVCSTKAVFIVNILVIHDGDIK